MVSKAGFRVRKWGGRVKYRELTPKQVSAGFLEETQGDVIVSHGPTGIHQPFLAR